MTPIEKIRQEQKRAEDSENKQESRIRCILIDNDRIRKGLMEGPFPYPDNQRVPDSGRIF
jgi:hypothetical protein